MKVIDALAYGHISTIEGYPSQELTFQHLRQHKHRKILLIPLLLTAGDHANNDIAKDWKSYFEDQGYEVSVKLRGLGEIPEIRQIYINHLRQLMEE